MTPLFLEGAVGALEVPEKNIETAILHFRFAVYDYLDTTDRLSSLPIALSPPCWTVLKAR